MAITYDKKVEQRLKAAVMRGIVRATEDVRTEAISLILNGQKTGREYHRRGVVHRASAPGEAPASNTGRLVNSITTTYDFTKMVGRVSAQTAYGPFLEYGTRKMEPRPFLRPALANRKAETVRIIADEIKREFK